MADKAKRSRPLPLLAAFLAWLVPGAGHAYLGRTFRGVVIFVAIAATFWAGVAMGGVMTVDHQNERWWFAAQMCTGVHGLISWQRTQRVYEAFGPQMKWQGEHWDRPDGWSEALYQQKLTDVVLRAEGLALVAPTDTAARAYAGVAGLLNLMCIFDALMLAVMGVTGEPPPPRRPEPELPDS